MKASSIFPFVFLAALAMGITSSTPSDTATALAPPPPVITEKKETTPANKPAASPDVVKPQTAPERPVAPKKDADKTRPIKEGKYYKPQPHQEVPWVMTVDPLITPTGGAIEPWPAISVEYPPRKSIFPVLPSPFVMLYPKEAKGQNVAGLMQGYDLRTGLPTGKAFKIELGSGEHPALDPEGTFLAARVPSRENHHTIEVIEIKTGKVVRRLETGRGEEWSVPITFIAPDQLLTRTNLSLEPNPTEKTEYKVWNVRSGEKQSEFAFDHVWSPATVGISGGGKYMVFQIGKPQTGYRLVAIETGTGKVAGDMLFINKNDHPGISHGIAFSPDGKEFALLRQIGKQELWGQLMVFNTTDGKRLATHNLTDMIGVQFNMHGGLDSLQWVPDGSGWLLFGSMLVNRNTGKEQGKIEVEKEAQYRRFVGTEQVTHFTGGLEHPQLRLQDVVIKR